MKKIILTILIAVIFTTSYSQVNYGIRSGLNLSDYSNLDTDKRINFYLGMTLAINFSKSYILQPEVSYSKQGAIFHLVDGTDYNLYSDNISVSVSNKFKVSKKLRVVVGPYYDMRLNESVSTLCRLDYLHN